MKRVLVIILLAAMVLSVSAPAFAQEDGDDLTRVQAAEEIVTALYLSGEDTSFSFADHYCLHAGGGGSAHFVPDEYLPLNGYPILCELYTSVSGPGFADISEEKGNLSVFVSLAKAMGFISGYGDNTFRPDKPVTYNEAVKMLVSAFGFDSLAESYGGYPSGYKKAAEELGITAGMPYNGTAIMNPQDFSEMLDACLDASYAQNFRALFRPPLKPEECVEMYAHAVANRDGVLQFALYDDELKASTRDGFVSFGWVTGVSSPWVSGALIGKTGDLAFDVTFQYATSTGPSGDETVSLTLEKTDRGYKITGLA